MLLYWLHMTNTCTCPYVVAIYSVQCSTYMMYRVYTLLYMNPLMGLLPLIGSIYAPPGMDLVFVCICFKCNN